MWHKLSILPFILVLVSCGFEPLYVQRQSDQKWYYQGQFDTSITSELSKIKIEPVGERMGQLVRNDLLDNLTPKGVPDHPKYRLRIINISKTLTEQAMREDITATRERVEYRLNYTLVSAQTGEILVSGDTLALLGYDIMANPYSTTFSQKKIEKNAAKIMADDISLRIGAYFHSIISQTGTKNEL